MISLKKFVSLGLLMGCSCMLGCGQNPGTWDSQRTSDYVKDALAKQDVDVAEISLKPLSGGGFEGIAKSAQGESFKLSITQDAASKSLTWDAKSDRGSFLDGSITME